MGQVIGKGSSLLSNEATDSKSFNNCPPRINISAPMGDNKIKSEFLCNIQYEIVINAYIFQIEQELSPNTIIPETIISLCSQYYDNEELIYLMNTQYYKQDHTNSLYAMNVCGEQMWKCNVISLLPNDTINFNHCVAPQYVSTRNVKLHPKIAQYASAMFSIKLHDEYRLKHEYDVVFVSETTSSHALIIDSSQNYRSNDSLFALSWRLKQKTHSYGQFGQMSCNQCTAATFSHKYGLIEFRGLETTIGYYLRFDEYDDEAIGNWKWKQIKHTINPHHISTIAMLDDNDKLVALGGNFPMEIYDFKNKEWKALAQPKIFPSTTCYDSGLEVLYVSNCINKVDYYNFAKEKWFKLPDTNNRYYQNFAMSKQYNLLYIATSLTNPIEFIDVRMSNNRKQKGWQICEPMKTHIQGASAIKYIVKTNRLFQASC